MHIHFTQTPIVFAREDCAGAGEEVPFARAGAGGGLTIIGIIVVRANVNAWKSEKTA